MAKVVLPKPLAPSKQRHPPFFKENSTVSLPNGALGPIFLARKVTKLVLVLEFEESDMLDGNQIQKCFPILLSLCCLSDVIADVSFHRPSKHLCLHVALIHPCSCNNSCRHSQEIGRLLQTVPYFDNLRQHASARDIDGELHPRGILRKQRPSDPPTKWIRTTVDGFCEVRFGSSCGFGSAVVAIVTVILTIFPQLCPGYFQKRRYQEHLTMGQGASTPAPPPVSQSTSWRRDAGTEQVSPLLW